MIRRIPAIVLVFVLISYPAMAAETAPDFSIHDVNTGKDYRLSDFRGSFVLIDFMSLECTGCEEVEVR